MRRTIIAVLGTTFCCSLLLSTGCEDPKKRIALLEQEKKELGDQLMEATQERDAAQAEVSDLKGKNSQLQSALSQAQQAPPPPPPAPTLQFIGALDTTDLGRVNKPELSAKARAQLDAIVGRLKGEFAGKHVYVIGHTDNDPIKRTKWKDNLELSCQRAMAVVRYLAAKGIRQTHLIAAGAGQFDPLAPNTSKANKAKNRRVDLYVGPKPKR